MRTGKLVKGGEPDLNNCSKHIIMDWQRGNIPYFNLPPKAENAEESEDEAVEEKEVKDELMGEDEDESNDEDEEDN